MEPIIDLAPGAEHNLLAKRFGDALRDNLRNHPEKTRVFRAIRGAAGIVPFDTGDAFTLRFDLGRLTVHDGHVGIPTVTIGGPSNVLLQLLDLPISKRLRFPVPRLGDASGSSALRSVGRHFWSGELKIYGLVSHPRLIGRLLRILSRQS